MFTIISNTLIVGSMRHIDFKAFLPYRKAPLLEQIRALGSLLTRPVSEILAHVPTTSKVLDFGAGDGLFSAYLAKKGHEVVAVEPDYIRRSMGERLHRDLKNLRFIGSLDELDLNDIFDTIIIVDVIYLLAQEDRLATARQLSNHLAKGAVSIIKEIVRDRIRPWSLVNIQEYITIHVLKKTVSKEITFLSLQELRAFSLTLGEIIHEETPDIAWYPNNLIISRKP